MIVEHDVADPRLELVTFTSVRLSADLRKATVLYSCLGDENARARCAEGLAHATKRVRGELGHRLPLRYVPELRFLYDDSYERAERVDRLLRGEDSKKDDPS